MCLISVLFVIALLYCVLNSFGIANPLVIVLYLLSGFIIVFRSVTGRKRAKWLGVFMPLPTMGYYDALEQLISVPVDSGIILEKNMFQYYMLADCLLLGVIIYLYYKNPKLIQRLEEDIENRMLTVPEEAGLWAVSIWLFVFGSFAPLIFPESVVPHSVYLNISNFIVAAVIVLLILDSNYRRYYYQRNMSLQKSLITVMADLVESRDENTGGHIPDAILNKPGRFDDGEFTIMKSHASAGGTIISQVEESTGDIEYLRIAKEMAEYHHEWVNGKGYPHGLTGDEIPLCAKILAVADVFDALVSKRCYKEPFPLDKAFAIIEEEAGSHFDTDVADAFMKSRQQIEQYIKEIS